MNIQQIQKDVDNGVMICRTTVHKVLAAAGLMEQALINLADSKGHNSDYARAVVDRVEEL